MVEMIVARSMSRSEFLQGLDVAAPYDRSRSVTMPKAGRFVAKTSSTSPS